MTLSTTATDISNNDYTISFNSSTEMMLILREYTLSLIETNHSFALILKSGGLFQTT